MTKAKIAAGLAAVGAALVLVGGPASAGEVTGNGDSLKQADGTLHGASACAFSGRNDGYFDGTEPGVRVQSFGQIVKTFAAEQQVDDTAHVGIGSKSGTHGVGAPGNSCNPTTVHIPE